MNQPQKTKNFSSIDSADVRGQRVKRNHEVEMPVCFGEISIQELNPKLIEKYNLKVGDVTPFCRTLIVE